MPSGHYKTIKGVPKDPMIVARMSIDELKALGLSQAQAYAARRTATADYRSQGANESVKQKALALITAGGPIRDIDDLRGRWGLGAPSPYDLTKALWALQKSGDITFYERKQGKDSLLTQIKLPKGTTHRALKAKSNGHHPVGKDMTDPKRHGNTAVVVSSDPRPAKPTPKVVQEIYTQPARVPEPATPRYSAASPLPQNTKPFTDEGSDSSQDAGSASAPTEVTRKDGSSDTHTQYLSTLITVDNYPLIFELKHRGARNAALEKAAEALIEVDEIAANQLLERVMRFSDLEKEVIRLLESGDDV